MFNVYQAQDQVDSASVKTDAPFSYANATNPTNTAQQLSNQVLSNANSAQLVSQNPNLYLNQQQQQINNLIENHISLNQTSSITFPVNSSGFDELLLR